MTSPADELRAAATKLRETASKATPGPWGAAKPDNEAGQYLDGRPERVVVALVETWSNGAQMVMRNAAELEWIALASPEMAEPLAAWLEHVAIDHEIGAPQGITVLPPTHPALMLARVVNGGQQS